MFRTLLRSQLVFDVTVAVLATVLAVVSSGSDASGIAVTVGFGLALGLRRLAPGAALTIALIAALVQMATGQTVMLADLLVPGVVYATSAYGSATVKTAGLVSAIVGSIVGALYLTVKEYLQRYDLAGSLVDNPSQILKEGVQGVAYFIIIVALLVLPWLAGLVVRTRGRARMSREAQLLAERDAARSDRAVAVEQERVRIARDMHDIVAHSLAVVIAQADGARYALQASPESADAALTTIGTTARRALADVRDLLGALRHEQGTAPTPGDDDIELLVGQMREVGLDVALERSGDPGQLPTTSQLAVYRIVQEGLTNALKHGEPESRVRVGLAYRPDHVEIAVVNRRRHDGVPGPGTGHGLVGMRERAALSGGAMSAGVRGDDFRVEVRIPTTTGPVRMPGSAPTTGSVPTPTPTPTPTPAPVPSPAPTTTHQNAEHQPR